MSRAKPLVLAAMASTLFLSPAIPQAQAPTMNTVTDIAAKQKALSDPAIEATIRKLENDVTEARTLDDLSKLFAPDVEYYNSYPAPVHSFQTLVGHMGEYAPGVKDWKVTVLEMKITARKDLAVASSIQRWQADSISTGKPVMDQYYRQTDVWEKIGDRWLITYAHSSFPVDPKTETVACMYPNGACPLPNWPHEKKQ